MEELYICRNFKFNQRVKITCSEDFFIPGDGLNSKSVVYGFIVGKHSLSYINSYIVQLDFVFRNLNNSVSDINAFNCVVVPEPFITPVN